MPKPYGFEKIFLYIPPLYSIYMRYILSCVEVDFTGDSLYTTQTDVWKLVSSLSVQM